jgi:ion channel POLLUX/CASTOR
MFNEVPEKERERKLTDGGLIISKLRKLRLVHKEGNAVIRRHLESLPLETFDSVSIFQYLSYMRKFFFLEIPFLENLKP